MYFRVQWGAVTFFYIDAHFMKRLLALCNCL